jgi:NADH/NAD ratio-sensing transcriptional regulator Rex
MKINYEKILINLKTSLFLLGDNFKNNDIKYKLKSLILEIDKIKEKEKKIKKTNKINTTVISVNPKRSIEVIDELIKKEIEDEKKLNDNKEL